MEGDDERREATIASTPSLQPNFKSGGATQAQLAKFRELHRRRLQIKARSKIEKKVIGTSGDKNKPHLEELVGAKGGAEEISSKERDDSSTSVLIENTRDVSDLWQDNATAQAGLKKRRKLHWGLDTKERWERKANM